MSSIQPNNNNAVQALIQWITSKNSPVTLPTIPTGDPSIAQASPIWPMFQDIQGTIDSMPNAPTQTPKSLWGSIKIALGRLFVFDSKNNTWLSFGSPQYEIGAGTSPSSNGTQTINCGFAPKLIKIRASYNSGSGINSMCWGEAVSSSVQRNSYIWWSPISNMGTGYSTSTILNILNSSGTTICSATISAISDTGFTLNFTITTQVITYFVEAYG